MKDRDQFETVCIRQKKTARVKYNLDLRYGPKRPGTGESIVGCAKQFGARISQYDCDEKT